MTSAADPDLATFSSLPGQTRFSRGLAVLAVIPAALGLALGNPSLLALAAAPAIVLARARGKDPDPEGVSVGSALETRWVRRGDAPEVGLEARLELGNASALVHQPLPDAFALEEGSNLHLHPGDGTRSWALRPGAAARGEHELPPPEAVSVHPLLLAPPHRLERGEAAHLVVEPRAPAPYRARGIEGDGADPPGERQARHGVESTDFRELREYVPGDPVTRVNWKATARESTRDVELMVNEFETEARPAVWFFLDLDPSLDVGTTTATALDGAVASCIALVRRLARRGHRVGGTTYNGAEHTFHPEAGARRAREVARRLAPVEAGDGDEGLAAAAERVRCFLARANPAAVVLTRPEADPGGLLEGVRRIHALRPAREPPPVTLLVPEAPAADAAEAAARRVRARAARDELVRPGLGIRPVAEGAAALEEALAKGVAPR